MQINYNSDGLESEQKMTQNCEVSLNVPEGLKGVEVLNVYKEYKEAAASHFPKLETDRTNPRSGPWR